MVIGVFLSGAYFDEKLRFLNQTSLLTGSVLTDTLMKMFILSTTFQRRALNVKLVRKFKLSRTQSRQRKKKGLFLHIQNTDLDHRSAADSFHYCARDTRDLGSLPLKTTNIKLLRRFFLNLTLFCRKNTRSAQNRICVTSQQLSEMMLKSNKM